jgi:hypothetical protein
MSTPRHAPIVNAVIATAVTATQKLAANVDGAL